MDEEYAEYRCSACRKAIKSKVVRCKTCPKLFYHPGCVNKHRIYDRNQEYVPCKGPFEEFLTDIEKAPTPTGRDRTSSTGSVGMSSGSKGSGIDLKIDWIIKAVKEIKDEAVRKNEIKTMIKEVVQEELENVKQEIETLKKMIHGSKEGPQRSYSEAVKEKKKENVIIVKPKLQQESEDTKKVIKEKVDIKNMAMGVTKLKKGSKGVVIMGCESGEEVKKLKETVQAKLGENYKVLESSRSKPKVKIVNINLEEMNLDDNELINTIKKQNRIDTVNMRIVKRMVNNQRRGNEGSVIMEIDEETHELILKKSKLNIGWKKCPIFNHISVKRCFKCWGYFHIAKNCTKEETCCKCAGNHSSRVCTATESKCVNCMFKNRTYNLKINDEHEAISRECPTFKRALQEEKRRAGCEDTK